MVRKHARHAKVIWLPSRFPRYVMLVEPGAENESESESGSIFESPRADTRQLASFTEFLEEQIAACLVPPARKK